MHILVGEQTGMQEAVLGINQTALIDAAVVRFMMFKAKMREVVAEAVNEMIVAEVTGSEEFECLIGERLVIAENIGGRVEGGGAVGGNIHFLVRILCQRNNAQIFTSNDWRIHQRGQRSRAKFDLGAILRCDRQRRTELPSGGKAQAGGVGQF